MKLFDAHMHVGRFGKNKMKDREIELFTERDIDSKEKMKEYMSANEIHGAVIVPHYNASFEYPFREGNKTVIDVCRSCDNVFGGLWLSPMKRFEELNNEILDNKLPTNIRAVKFSHNSWTGGVTANPRSWDNGTRETAEKIFDFCEKNKLVVHLHTGSQKSVINSYTPLVEEYGEKVRFQFVHMGNSAGGIIAFVPRFVEWLQQGYDFYCDTSGSWGFGPEWLIKEMEKKHPAGLDRVLFATDYPWGSVKAEYWKIKGMDCSNEIKEKILFENGSKLYK
jgi:uncharacterized protein